jgi:hypothetical protein
MDHILSRLFWSPQSTPLRPLVVGSLWVRGDYEPIAMKAIEVTPAEDIVPYSSTVARLLASLSLQMASP